MGEKSYNQQRESKKRRRRVQKINCPNPSCKGKIVVEDEMDNGNFYETAGVKYLECPYCGQEIII